MWLDNITYVKVKEMLEMTKQLYRIGLFALALFLLLAFTMELVNEEAYAKTIKLNKKAVYMSKGSTYQLKVKGTTAKVKWKSSDPKIVSVSKKGKLKAKSYGIAKISAKVKGKTLKCKVKVERKGEKYARILRSYILKHGKKSGSTYYIKKEVYSGDESEGTTRTTQISATKKSQKLEFSFSRSTTEPPASRNLTLKIDLISGSKAVRTGKVFHRYDDGYGIDTWEEYYADITTRFAHTYNSSEEDGATGITITKYISNDDEDNKVITDKETLTGDTYMRAISVNTSWSFSEFDKLIKSQKKLTGAKKITMNTLGFTKMKY